jgi:hypothetical protein
MVNGWLRKCPFQSFSNLWANAIKVLYLLVFLSTPFNNR